MTRLLSWLDARTGYRAGVARVLEEPLASGVGWWFVSGSVVLFLLVVQVLTGFVLAMYYVPTPELAYESVRFIMTALPFGSVVRGLHVFGASFIVVAAVVHMLRVVLFGSYKAPREVTWMTGVVLLLIVMGFALSGYLLPWDQKAYWATTVTINIARSTPLAGDALAAVLRGGADLGALTLGRWYAVHVFALPAALVAFVIAHLFLMRRHGISGPIVPRAGAARPFYPYHAIKDTVVIAVVFALLVTMASTVRAPLDAMADPSDAAYVPRPEWYFMSLFQLLKYFPGPLEPVATIVVPGLLVGLLFLLPFVDRYRDRHPFKRPVITSAVAVVGMAVAALTWLGLQDAPAHANPDVWGPVALGGRELTRNERCVGCHRPGGPAGELDRVRMGREPEWVIHHVQDPEIVGPGVREPPEGGFNDAAGRAVVTYMRKLQAGAAPPGLDMESATAARVFATRCASCHSLDREGDASTGGDLSHAGREHDERWLRQWIADPASIDPATEMPAFGERLTTAELRAIAAHLARRR